MQIILPIALVIILVFWTWAQQRLRTAAQPLRLELAERGERLLGDPQLPKHLHGYVEFLLNTAFNNRTALIFGFVAGPAILFSAVRNPRKFRAVVGQFTIKNDHTLVAYNEVNRLHKRITFANHPVLTTLLEFEISVLSKLCLTATALIYGKVPSESAMVKTIIEVKEQEYRNRLGTILKAA